MSSLDQQRSSMSPPPLSGMHLAFTRRFLAGLLLILILAGCSQQTDSNNKKGGKQRAAIVVAVATSVQKAVPVIIRATGHMEASATVEIRSQVTGTLQSVHFQEGAEVKAGAILLTIDPRPFAANLAKAEATLAKDRAELDNARNEADRYTLAARKGYVSTEQADQAATRVATLSATVRADQAAIDAARLELEYCTIRAPFAGRTGELLVDQGNLVKANGETPLLTINQTRPILAAFTVPGQHLHDIIRYRSAGTLAVLADTANGNDSPLVGRLVFIDNTVDPTTGVIRLKASFDDRQQLLWPGQLVDVRIHLTDRANCIVIPARAVQAGQEGPYVYVVEEDQTARYRRVTPGILHQGETVIDAGLAAGERVVIDGQMQLADGVKVVEGNGAKERTAAGPPEPNASPPHRHDKP